MNVKHIIGYGILGIMFVSLFLSLVISGGLSSAIVIIISSIALTALLVFAIGLISS